MEQVIYLTRIVVGLIVIGAAMISASIVKHLSGVGEVEQGVITLICLAIFIGLIPFIYSIYRKMDELQKRLHEFASVYSNALIISFAGTVGSLQALGFVPLFNMFWVFGCSIAIWSIALMLNDRKYK